MITDEARSKMGWKKGKVFTKYSKNCLVCSSQFFTVPTSSKQKTCSINCSSLLRKSGKEIICRICFKKVYSTKSRNKVYCSTECKIKGLAELKKERFLNKRKFNKWKNAREQKKWFLETYNKCQICGFCKEVGILEIHHKDRDRSNNEEENLILLCPNCHSEEHFKNKDGQFKNNLGIYATNI